MSQNQTKSKKRVRDHGEVFTAEREVKAMCDLVKDETERIDSRFLEPACGTGNFLEEILTRKLAVVKKLYKSNPYDYERYAVLAATGIYGVELLADNVRECRERLFELWNKEYTSVCKKSANDETREAVKYILSKNVICANGQHKILKAAELNVDQSRNPISDYGFPINLFFIINFTINICFYLQ